MGNSDIFVVLVCWWSGPGWLACDPLALKGALNFGPGRFPTDELRSRSKIHDLEGSVVDSDPVDPYRYLIGLLDPDP